MRILYLHQYFVEPSAPGSTRSYELARRLVARGHEVDLLTTDWQETSSIDAQPDQNGFAVRTVDGVRVHATRVAYANSMGFRRRLAAFGKYAVRVLRYARRLDYDVVFASSTPLTVAIPGIRLAAARNVPFVFEVRDLWPDIPVVMGAIKNPAVVWAARRLEEAAYRRARSIVVLSPDMRDVLAARGIPEHKLVVIPNGCDLDLFSTATAADGLGGPAGPAGPAGLAAPAAASVARIVNHHPLVVYTGSMGLVNHVEYLVGVAGILREMNPDVRFAVFGQGARETEVRRLAAENGTLDATFFLHPPIAKNDMPAVLKAADVAVSLVANHPELWANSANKFFDAIASGTAVAINYEGWQANLIREYDAGIVLPPEDAHEASRLLNAFVSDPDRLQRAGANARRLATTFDRDQQAERLAEIFEAL